MEVKAGLTFCLFYFLFFCYFPFKINLKSLKAHISVKALIWSVMFSGFMIFFGQSFDRFFYKPRKIFRLIFSVENIFHRLSSSVIFISVFLTIIKSRIWLKIIRKLISIFKKLIKFQGKYKLKNVLKSFLIKYALIQVGTTMLSILFYLSLENTSFHGLIIFNTLSSVKYMFPSAFLLKLDFLLILLQIGFSGVNKAIKNIIAPKYPELEACELLEHLMEIHFSLCEVYEMIIKQVSVSLVTVLVYIFLIVQAHFLQTFLNFNENSTSFVNFRVFLSLIWTSIKSVELIVVFQGVGKVMRKVSTKYIIIWDS